MDVPAHMESADRKYKARSYTLGDAYGVEALRDKLREKAGERLRTAEQRNNAAESKPDIPQDGLNTEAAAWLPMNQTPEMKCVPEIKQKSARMVADTINALISGPRREVRAGTPISAQPAPTTPHTVTEGDGEGDSTPEGKQPTQGTTVPRECEGAFAEMQRMLKERDEKEAQRQSENDGMDWLPLR